MISESTQRIDRKVRARMRINREVKKLEFCGRVLSRITGLTFHFHYWEFHTGNPNAFYTQFKCRCGETSNRGNGWISDGDVNSMYPTSLAMNMPPASGHVTVKVLKNRKTVGKFNTVKTRYKY